MPSMTLAQGSVMANDNFVVDALGGASDASTLGNSDSFDDRPRWSWNAWARGQTIHWRDFDDPTCTKLNEGWAKWNELGTSPLVYATSYCTLSGDFVPLEVNLENMTSQSLRDLATKETWGPPRSIRRFIIC